MTIQSFQPDVRWIASQLGCSPAQASKALEKLEAAGLVHWVGGEPRKVHDKLYFDVSATSPALRSYHRRSLERVTRELDRTTIEDFSRRLVVGLTIGANPAKLDEAKARMHSFLQEMGDLLSDGRDTELYQVQMSLVPITPAAAISSPKTRTSRAASTRPRCS